MTETMGARIAAARKRRHLSRKFVAAKCGVTEQAVGQWERDEVPGIKPENMLQLTELLEVSLAYLVRGDPPGRAQEQQSVPAAGEGRESVQQVLARLYTDLGVQMIDREAMKRALRAVEKLFAKHPGYSVDFRAVVLARAYEETLRDAEAADRVVREAMQQMQSQRSNAKKRSARGEK